jgi:hypothetical protein
LDDLGSSRIRIGASQICSHYTATLVYSGTIIFFATQEQSTANCCPNLIVVPIHFKAVCCNQCSFLMFVHNSAQKFGDVASFFVSAKGKGIYIYSAINPSKR